jgi:prevent-host-death family protein
MEEGPAPPEHRIGVRELRQHASRYLHRVAAGESFTVTDRGTPVAHLVPPGARITLADRISSGELLVPQHPTGALSGRLPAPLDLGFNASEELARLREEERW